MVRGFITGHDDPDMAHIQRDEVGWTMLLPLIVLAVLSVVLGMFPAPLTELFTRLAAQLM